MQEGRIECVLDSVIVRVTALTCPNSCNCYLLLLLFLLCALFALKFGQILVLYLYKILIDMKCNKSFCIFVPNCLTLP